MLQVIRDNAQGFIAWIIVGAIVITLGLFGLSSYFNDTEEAFQAALVNGEKVTVYEYQIAYSNERARMQQMFGQNFDPDLFDSQIKKSALERVIDNALLTQRAQANGMHISDEQLALRVHNIVAFQEDGVFSKALYEQQLGQAGESPAGFEYRMRRGMMADQLVNGIIGSSFATEDEIALTYKLREQQRELTYITFPLAKFREQVNVSDEEIKAYYEKHKDQFKSPEQVKVRYLELSVDDLMPEVEVNEDELESYYEEQKSRFVTPEERHARHILIEFGDDKEKAKQKAEEVATKAKSGEDFTALAKEYSDDIGSKNEGGDLGFFGRGVMDENFEEAVFAMKPGDISGPVESQFGYHIIKLEEIRSSKGKSFAEVKSELDTEVRKQKAEKLYFDKSELLANLTYENPDSLDVAAEELGLKIKTSPFISRQGGPGIFRNRKLVEAAFSKEVLEENLNSEALEIGNDKMVVLRLAEHKPAEPRPLEQVKARIKRQLEKDKALELAKAEAKTFEEKLKANESVAELAGEKGFTVQDKRWTKRDNQDIPREIIQALFALPRKTDNAIQTKGVTLNNGDYSLIALSGIKDGDFSKITKEERKAIADGIANATGVDYFTAYLQALKDKAEVKTFPENL